MSSILGKVLGGMAGMAMGGPFGAVLGAAAGHAVDRMREEGTARLHQMFDHYAEHARQMAFSAALVALAARMAGIDGPVNRAELEAFTQTIQVPPAEKAAVAHLFALSGAAADGYEAYARQIAALFPDRPDVPESVLGALLAIAVADGPLNPAERAMLERVAAIFGMRPGDWHATGGQVAGPDPYVILGVSPEATDEAIKTAYRRLIREHHPDALAAKGLSQSHVAGATRRMATINAAFDRVARERGMK